MLFCEFFLISIPVAFLALIGLGLKMPSSQYYTEVKVIRNQPVPFSHKHHSGELGIDCRYCHISVEKSSFAGIPSPSTCMHCHSQIWPNSAVLEPVRRSYRAGVAIRWSRVHNLPDYAYFDHSIHVAKGIGCASCHGRVDKMALVWKEASLEMRWCLDCHRAPENHVRPRREVFNMEWAPAEPQARLGKRLVGEYHIQSKTDCHSCHR